MIAVIPQSGTISPFLQTPPMTLLRSALIVTALLAVTPTALAASQGDTVIDTHGMTTHGVDYLESRHVLASNVWLPSGTITRGEFVRMVTSLVYEHDVNPLCFSELATQNPVKYRLLFREVSLQDPLAEFLCAGLKAGIIHGNVDGTFRADQPITVAEASQILYRAYDVGPLNRESLKGQAWYRQAMHDMKVAELLPGTLYDTPLHHLTLGEAGEIFVLLHDREQSLRQAGDIRLMRGATTDTPNISITVTPVGEQFNGQQSTSSPTTYIFGVTPAGMLTPAGTVVTVDVTNHTSAAPLGYMTVWARGIEWTIPRPVSRR